MSERIERVAYEPPIVEEVGGFAAETHGAGAGFPEGRPFSYARPSER
ncbi:lasso RiPP family leader peptide-containing protein [Saccharopolyspora pogona]|nr:lasso RiPP family leader peptide-containing protein [Saccharopolyspora pogona]